MKLITEGNSAIRKFISDHYNFNTNEDLVLSKYCIVHENGDEVLLFNLLNYSFITLTKEEYTKFNEKSLAIRSELIKLMFLVPQSLNLKAIADAVDKEFRRPHSTNILDRLDYAVIFTSTNCNARCPYCFEGLNAGKDMDEKTANDVADFLIRHCMHNGLKIRWFGGEPLCNPKAIEIISDKLNAANVPYTSEVFTNAYLITDDVIKLLKKAKVDKAQIPVDGDEEYYNKIKNFKNAEGNPFYTVLENIDKLLSAGIKVNIRVNLSLESYDSASRLVPYLKERFGARAGISVMPVYQMLKNETKKEDRVKFLEKLYTLRRKYPMRETVPMGLKQSKCMADNGHSLGIYPEGKISVCEHYTHTHFIGTIYDESLNLEELAKMRDRSENNLSVCDDCPLYPYCYRLKYCTELRGCSVCNEELREYNINVMIGRMLKTRNFAKNNNVYLHKKN